MLKWQYLHITIKPCYNVLINPATWTLQALCQEILSSPWIIFVRIFFFFWPFSRFLFHFFFRKVHTRTEHWSCSYHVCAMLLPFLFVQGFSVAHFSATARKLMLIVCLVWLLDHYWSQCWTKYSAAQWMWPGSPILRISNFIKINPLNLIHLLSFFFL